MPKEKLHPADLHEEIPFWLNSRWIINRGLPNLFIIGIWSAISFTILYSLAATLPVFALSLIAIGSAFGVFLLGQWFRDKFILPVFKPFYRWILRTLFAKSIEDSNEIIDHLIDKRTFSEQLVDYIRYNLGRRLRENEEENTALKIRIAQFNARWGAKARFILSGYILIQALIFFAASLFGIALSPGAVIGLIIVGIFGGGVCGALANDNLLANGLVSLAKRSDAEQKRLEAEVNPWDRRLGKLFCFVHGIAMGVACFAAALKLVPIMTSFPLVAANPLMIPLFLGFVGLCSLAVGKGYYSLGYKLWLNKKKILKGLFYGKDFQGNEVGFFQRSMGIIGAILFGVVVSLAFIMLNGSSFALTVGSPIYTLTGTFLQFNFSASAISAFIFAGVIGWLGNAIILFCGTSTIFRGIGKRIDQFFSIKKDILSLTPDEQIRLKNELSAHKFSEHNSGSKESAPHWYKLHWKLEQSIRVHLIIFFNGIGNGALASFPNAVVLFAVAPPLALPVGMALFGLTMISSICKDEMNWVVGHENRAGGYLEAKKLLEQAIILDRVDSTENKARSAELRRKAAEIRDGYDPHFFITLLTGIVRVVSNIIALFALPIVMIMSTKKPSAIKPQDQLTNEVSTLPVGGIAAASAEVVGESAPLVSQVNGGASPALFAVGPAAKHAARKSSEGDVVAAVDTDALLPRPTTPTRNAIEAVDAPPGGSPMTVRLADPSRQSGR